MSIKKTIITVLCAAALFSLSGCKSQDYNTAMEMMVNQQWSEAKAIFTELADYKDSANLLKECNYNIAQDIMDSGDYEKAIGQFEALEGYKESAEMIKECSYKIACALYEDGEYDAAMEAFDSLGDYSDSKDMITECTYQKARTMFEAGEYKDALPLFESLEDYEDSIRSLAVCRFATENERYVKELARDIDDIFEENYLAYKLYDVSEMSDTGDLCYYMIGEECSNKVIVGITSVTADWDKVEGGQPNCILVVGTAESVEELELVFAEVMYAGGAALAALDSASDSEDTMLNVIKEFETIALSEVSDISEVFSSTDSEFEQNGFNCFAEVSDMLLPNGDANYGFAFGIQIPELID